MENEIKLADVPRKERNFPTLELTEQTLNANVNQPLLVVQSPKTPTLSRKLKAASLDSDPPKQGTHLEVNRDVFSMPNTPKRQIKQKLLCDFDDATQKFTLTPSFSTNLARFGSNTSISGSQTLKTLPEVMTLQDFSDNRAEPVRIKAKGLLERRGSNASLTIDLGSSTSIAEIKAPIVRLNPARSVNNLNLSSFGIDKCSCPKKCDMPPTVEKRPSITSFDRRKSQSHLEKCDNCTIYEAEPSKSICNIKCQKFNKKCACLCNYKSRRKSLSNENLYVPPCNICQGDAKKDCSGLSKGHRRACYPRQADLEASQLLSEDFKFYLQNIQYLQTAGSVLSIQDLKLSCQVARLPKIHQEFWEVPLNLQEKCLVSGSQTRNRYRGVLPNEHSRVQLPGPQPYIHANYIKGPDYTENSYIATQGPMAHTCEDFWDMIWMTKCNCIVMLTGLVEKGRTKCELYFPLGKQSPMNEKSYFTIKTTKLQDRFTFEKYNTQQYEEEVFQFEELNEILHGKYRIQYVKKESLGECTIRHLKVSRKNNECTGERLVSHYWFPNWQDHKMANPDQVLSMAMHVIELTDRSSKLDVNRKDITLNEQKFGGQGVMGSKFSNESKINKVETKDNEVKVLLQSSSNQVKFESFDRTEEVKCFGSKLLSTITNNSKIDSIINTFSTKTNATLENRNSARLYNELSKITPSNSINTKMVVVDKSGHRRFLREDFLKSTSISRDNVLDAKKSQENDKPLVVVHCSAGIGRTGCFLAILNGIQQIRSNSNVDVLAILCSLRLHRGGMVQTAEQYELIHRVLKLYTETM